MVSNLKRRFADSEFFWGRHSNPASGWSRVPTGPLFLYALYRRNWKLLVGTILFVVVNPILFPEKESETGERETDGWMARGVRGEQRWLQGADAGRANWLNVANVPVFCYALYATYRQKPRATVVATVAMMALKLLFVNEMAKLYDREQARQIEAPFAD